MSNNKFSQLNCTRTIIARQNRTGGNYAKWMLLLSSSIKHTQIHTHHKYLNYAHRMNCSKIKEKQKTPIVVLYNCSHLPLHVCNKTLKLNDRRWKTNAFLRCYAIYIKLSWYNCALSLNAPTARFDWWKTKLYELTMSVKKATFGKEKKIIVSHSSLFHKNKNKLLQKHCASCKKNVLKFIVTQNSDHEQNLRMFSQIII